MRERGGRLADHGDVLRLLGMRERVERPCSPRRSPSEPGRSARPRRCTDSSPNRKITWAGWRTWSCIPSPGPRTRPTTWRTSTLPSRGAAATLHTGSSRPSMHSPTGFGLLAHPGVQGPGTLPMRHPRPSDTVLRIPALSLPEDSARYGRRRRLPGADPLRYAEAEIAVFACFPSSIVHAELEPHRRQSRRSSPTKINNEVISKQIQNGRGEG